MRSPSSQVSEDVLWKVALFIEPDITVYTRLAAVNRAFYAVFTSDKLWKPYNPYGVDAGFFRSFQSSFEGLLDSKLLRFYWVGGDARDEPLSHRQLKLVTRNQFVWLGHLLKSFGDLDNFTEFASLISCAVDLWYADPNQYRIDSEFLLYNREYALRLVKLRPELFWSYRNIPQFEHDRELQLVAASGQRTNFDVKPFLSYFLWSELDQIRDSTIAEVALQNDPRNLEHVSSRLREKYVNDRDWVLSALEQFPSLMSFCEKYKDDTEVVMRMYSGTPREKQGFTLQRLSERLRQDPLICKMAIYQYPWNIGYCLAYDIDLYKYAMAHLKGKGGDTGCTCEELCQLYGNGYREDMEANRLTALAARASVFPKKALSPEYLSNESEMLELFSDPSMAWAVHEVELAQDPEFVVKVMELNKSPEGWPCLRDQVKRHPDVALAALKCGVEIEKLEKFVGPIFSTNREMVKLSAECAPLDKIFKIPSQFADDEEIVKLAVKKRGCSLKYASDRLKANAEVVSLALDARGQLNRGLKCVCLPFKYISTKLLEDGTFFIELLRLACTCPREHLPTNDMALFVLENCPYNYKFLLPELKSSLAFNIKAAATNAGTLRLMSDEMILNSAVLEFANFQCKPLFNTHCGLCFQ